MTSRQPVLPAERRRLAVVALVRSLGVTTLLVTIYYVAPLDRVSGVKLGFVLGAGLLLLAAAVVYELRATLRSPHPAVRAAQALATTIPLLLLMFAATYYVMSVSRGGDFNVQSLSRTDALYFTVTVFATVGFGDIVATSETGRALVTIQMILDLIAVGLVVRVFFGAVQLARHAKESTESESQQADP